MNRMEKMERMDIMERMEIMERKKRTDRMKKMKRMEERMEIMERICNKYHSKLHIYIMLYLINNPTTNVNNYINLYCD